MSRSPYVGLHVATGARRATAAAIVASVQREISADGVRWTRPGGLWLDVPRSVDMSALEAHLARGGVHISNASAAFIGAAHLHGFRIAYAFLSEMEMRSALTIVADALRTLAR